ncbi:hypothetical protein THRCLA_09438 [Thraustotheca clavata]|uniref:Transmembrane protein n=1 Tax=Thraustotheca clavata TaxID=74557 RepID=A0A1V9YX26_9STRA|nr:hypothetical protein THRCLA_09438 [Thraustotheca clavata]
MSSGQLLRPDAAVAFNEHPLSNLSLWNLIAWPFQLLTYLSFLYIIGHFIWTGIGILILCLCCLLALVLGIPVAIASLWFDVNAASCLYEASFYHKILFCWVKVDVYLHNTVCYTSQRIPLRCEEEEAISLLEHSNQSRLIDNATVSGISRLVYYMVIVRIGLDLMALPWLQLVFWSATVNAPILARMSASFLRYSTDPTPDPTFVLFGYEWLWDFRPIVNVLGIIVMWLKMSDRRSRRSRSRDRYQSSSEDEDARERRRHREKGSRMWKVVNSDDESNESSSSSTDRRHEKRLAKKEKKHKKDKKHKKHKKSSKAVNQNDYGKYGILKESDFHTKTVSFQAWLGDVKKIPDFSGPKYEAMELFREYMEDYNTATFPHEKYYDIEKYESKKYRKQQLKRSKHKKSSQSIEEIESAHSQKMREKAEAEKRDFELIMKTMDKDKIADMRRQQQLRDQMQMHFKTGNNEEARRLESLLTKKEEKKRDEEFIPDTGRGAF